MNMRDVMMQKNFVVLGDTLNETKFAHKIKEAMLSHGYNVACVGKELESINDVEFDIDVLDLCINPIKGLKLLKENKKLFKTIVIQPGAENEELIEYLDEQKIDYERGCLLVGIFLYSHHGL